MGVMVMESGYGSAIPTCIIAHMSKNGAAIKSGLLNVGDHIIALNGVSLVGMPVKACVEQIKVWFACALCSGSIQTLAKVCTYTRVRIKRSPCSAHPPL